MNNYLTWQVHGNAGHAPSFIDSLNTLLTFFENLSGPGGGDMLATLLFPGLAGMNNIHPLFVHFPIALLSLFFILEVFATLSKKTHWHEISRYFLYFGTVSAILTVIAGFVAAYSVEHNEIVHLVMLRHQYLGLTVTTLAVILSVWRYKMTELTGVAKHLFLMLAGVMCILLALGADLGGLMVYHYGTGVQHALEPTVGEEHHH